MRKQKTNVIIAIGFLVFLAILCGICGWLFFTNSEITDLTDLSKKEIVHLAKDGSTPLKGFYTLRSDDYSVLGKFYEEKVIITRSKGSGDIVYYGYYTIRFEDKNGEPVVTAVRSDLDRIDLEREKADLICKMIMMDEKIQNKQDAGYNGSPETVGVILNTMEHVNDLKLSMLCAAAGIVCVGLIVVIIVRNRKYFG